jgi:hypothetical protein
VLVKATSAAAARVDRALRRTRRDLRGRPTPTRWTSASTARRSCRSCAPLRDGRITRVETLGGRFLYAIHVYPADTGFNLCPADACVTGDGRELARAACALDAPKNGLRVEHATDVPAEVIAATEAIARAARIDVGGIEWLVDDRDGRWYAYDVNALSNFVADAPNVVGFDPFARLADFLEARLAAAGAVAGVAGARRRGAGAAR